MLKLWFRKKLRSVKTFFFGRSRIKEPYRIYNILAMCMCSVFILLGLWLVKPIPSITPFYEEYSESVEQLEHTTSEVTRIEGERKSLIEEAKNSFPKRSHKEVIWMLGGNLHPNEVATYEAMMKSLTRTEINKKNKYHNSLVNSANTINTHNNTISILEPKVSMDYYRSTSLAMLFGILFGVFVTLVFNCPLTRAGNKVKGWYLSRFSSREKELQFRLFLFETEEILVIDKRLRDISSELKRLETLRSDATTKRNAAMRHEELSSFAPGFQELVDARSKEITPLMAEETRLETARKVLNGHIEEIKSRLNVLSQAKEFEKYLEKAPEEAEEVVRKIIENICASWNDLRAAAREINDLCDDTTIALEPTVEGLMEQVASTRKSLSKNVEKPARKAEERISTMN